MRCGPNVRYCPTARNFYRIRRVLTEALGLPRGEILPQSSLAELIPPRKRQVVQKLLCQQGLNVLDLSLSSSQSAIACLAPLVVLVLGLAIAISVGSGVLACTAFAGGFVAGCCTLAILARRATELSPTLTVKDAVIRGTRVRDYLNAGYEFESRDELFRKVCEIIGRNLGVNPASLTEETSFQEDIGAIDAAAILRGSKVAQIVGPKKAEAAIVFSDMDAPRGKTCYYYARIEQTDGNLAWLSPMWIAYRPK